MTKSNQVQFHNNLSIVHLSSLWKSMNFYDQFYHSLNQLEKKLKEQHAVAWGLFLPDDDLYYLAHALDDWICQNEDEVNCIIKPEDQVTNQAPNLWYKSLIYEEKNHYHQTTLSNKQTYLKKIIKDELTGQSFLNHASDFHLEKTALEIQTNSQLISLENKEFQHINIPFSVEMLDRTNKRHWLKTLEPFSIDKENNALKQGVERENLEHYETISKPDIQRNNSHLNAHHEIIKVWKNAPNPFVHLKQAINHNFFDSQNNQTIKLNKRLDSIDRRLTQIIHRHLEQPLIKQESTLKRGCLFSYERED